MSSSRPFQICDFRTISGLRPLLSFWQASASLLLASLRLALPCCALLCLPLPRLASFLFSLPCFLLLKATPVLRPLGHFWFATVLFVLGFVLLRLSLIRLVPLLLTLPALFCLVLLCCFASHCFPLLCVASPRCALLRFPLLRPASFSLRCACSIF